MKTYIKSGYIIKHVVGKRVYYKCCCKEEDLPVLKPPEKWHIYRVDSVVYYTNYEDYDLLYAIKRR